MNKPNNVLKEWLQISYEDYDTAKFLFDNKKPKPLEIICYHCQQSAEKALKGFLCANEIDPPKTHDVGHLCVLCAKYDKEFKKLAEKCEDIATYSAKTRYPNRVEIEEYDAKSALQIALEIHNYVIKRLKNMGITL